MAKKPIYIEAEPKMFRGAEIYKQYANKILKENPTYWGQYGQRMRNHIIYAKQGNSVIEVISYNRFMAILDTYFERARHYIIEGWELNLGNDLGVIAARRVERNFCKKIINHYATSLQPKDPTTGKASRVIYHTEPDWCRIGWKKSGKVANAKFYKFVPTPHDGQGKGFKKEFTDALKNNPLLRYRYEYFKHINDED
jgi:hypothetical protein